MKQLLSGVCLLGAGMLASSSYAVDCGNLPTWLSNDVYVGGAEVQYNNNAYRANYWTQNNNPELRSGPWQEWSLLGACDGGNPVPSPTPTVIPTPTPTATPSPNPGGSCTGLPRYAAGTNYSAGQEVVNYVEESARDEVFLCNIAGWCSSPADWAYEPGNGLHWGEAWSQVRSCDGTGGNQDPIANANGPYSAQVGDYVEFSSANSRDPDGSIVSYRWNFGDGSPVVEAQNPVYAYNAPGTYTAVLTVTDDVGASASDSASVSIREDDNPLPSPTPTPPPGPSGNKVIGYFTQWGVYGRNYHVKNIVTSGSAERLTHIMYAFGDVQNGRCVLGGDNYADFERSYDAGLSVDGVADTWDQPLKGNFNQLRKLKQMYPHIKVVWSFGGWTMSDGFGQAAANPQAFADSCYNLVHDPRWDGVFDGIDIDWEYPNACGDTCDYSGYEAYGNVMRALRNRFGNEVVSSAITASEVKLNVANYDEAAQYVDFYMVMTYDFFGAWDATGPTAPHSPLYSFPGIPIDGFYSDNAIQVLKSKGVPSNKLLLGIGFYGRGWSGVTQSAPGGSATGPAPGSFPEEQGVKDYEVLKSQCPVTGFIAGTAYAHCGNQWWSYDTPATVRDKMSYVRQQGLGGAFFWEFNGDTPNGELIKAISDGL